MRGREAALFGAAPARKGQLKGRRAMGGGQGQPRPGRVTHTPCRVRGPRNSQGGLRLPAPFTGLWIKAVFSVSAFHPDLLRSLGSALGQKSYGLGVGALSPDPNAGQLRGLTEQQGAHRVSREWHVEAERAPWESGKITVATRPRGRSRGEAGGGDKQGQRSHTWPRVGQPRAA